MNNEKSGTVEENPKAHPQGNAVKDPENWVTKNEPMTGAQASYLKTLSEEGHVEFDAELTKAEASIQIDDLQRKRAAALLNNELILAVFK